MDFLYFLENIRTPFFDWLFSMLTHLGDEPVFLALGLLIFWCVDKLEGYYLITVGFAGAVFNQTMKVIFRVPRPWVIDGEFSVVEAARERATGYSFPSGHTQFSVGIFGGIARWEKNAIIRILCIAACIIVPFSRMYLGVHTPLDVVVSAVAALVFAFGFYPVLQAAKKNRKIVPVFLAVLTGLLCISLAYMHLWDFPADIDAENLLSGQTNLWTLLGAAVGLFGAYIVDSKYVRFDTKAPLMAQVLKVIPGIIVVLIFKEGLKPILDMIFGDLLVKHALRYGVTVFVACGIWPMTFKWFAARFRK